MPSKTAHSDIPSTQAEPTARTFIISEHLLLAPKAAPGLHLVATPIGNLGDITLRALQTLAGADVIACEDTRVTRRLTERYGIAAVLKPYHEHNAAAARPKILQMLAEGASIALVSDAGTPLISDPGYKLVRAAIAEGYPVTSLPGASAVLTALAGAGLATDTFLFAGFLPPRQGARRSRLAELKTTPATLVFFEAPSRLAESIADIGNVLGDREMVIARELTKLHEELRRGSPAELAQWAEAGAPRGEMVILVGPPALADITDEAILSSLRPLLAEQSLRDAAKLIADELGVAKTRVYDLGLALKRGDHA
jgi:16S rRNA (cytidine1402-2'-O)-methyltransferase